jgi:hypothetical protein
MNGNIKLILILIVVLVLFTFVTGAHKGTEHFSTRECNKKYKTKPPRWACPINCNNYKQVYVSGDKVCDETNKNCKTTNKMTGWKCTK